MYASSKFIPGPPWFVLLTKQQKDRMEIRSVNIINCNLWKSRNSYWR